MSETVDTKTATKSEPKKRATSISLTPETHARLDNHSFVLRKRGLSAAAEAIIEAHLAGVESGKIMVSENGAISFV